MMFNKRFELTIAEGYVADWGVAEAIREILQNAIDSPSPFEYAVSGETLTVTSRGQRLSIASLLMGAGTKADDDDSIGKFGEGYKIALLVLTRLGYPVTIFNDDKTWTPSIEPSKTFEGRRVLVINQRSGFTPTGGLAFRIGGLSPADHAEVEACCLRMQEGVEEIEDDQLGRILTNRPGRLYVDGLLVCETRLKYGYDLHPSQIELERDRRTVSSFDLKFMAQRLWFRLATAERVAQEIEAEIPDLEYAKHGAPELVKDACYRLFQEKHPDAVVAKDQDELDRLVKAGMERVVVLGGSFGAIVSDSAGYQSSVPMPVLTIEQELRAWFEDCGKKQLNRKGKETFRAILRRATNWRK